MYVDGHIYKAFGSIESFCMKLKISITNEPIVVYILSKLHIGLVRILGNFNLYLSLELLLSFSNIDPLDAREVTVTKTIL